MEINSLSRSCTGRNSAAFRQKGDLLFFRPASGAQRFMRPKATKRPSGSENTSVSTKMRMEFPIPSPTWANISNRFMRCSPFISYLQGKMQPLSTSCRRAAFLFSFWGVTCPGKPPRKGPTFQRSWRRCHRPPSHPGSSARRRAVRCCPA